MILVHKPQSHFPTFPAGQTLTHRRHPSAPVPALVAVQPTRTPGLLSLSKPQIQAQQKPRSSPKLKHKSPQPAHAVATLKPAPEIVEKQEVAKVSQSPKKRGRQPAPGPKPKSTPRSASNRRQPTRQPSPPISSQAEVPSTPTTKPLFDSFSDDSSPTRLPTRPTPKLAPKPSGKLASRRQPGSAAPEITLPRAIPIPSRPQMPSLHKRASAPPGFAFPICDDISEAGDDGEDISSPVTPTQPRRSGGRRTFFDDGPKTAPLSAGSVPFRFSTSPPPMPFAQTSPAAGRKLVRPRRHVRSPSEGVFQMSDEETSTSSSGSSGDLMAALGLGLSASQKMAKFASSTFLNSPDPEALPPPSF